MASAPARKPSFCTMYSFTPSSSMMTISPGTVGANNTSPGPRLARNVWKKNFSPVSSLRDSAPRNPPSILLSTYTVGHDATMAPDSALMCSPASSSTRTMGNAPGYRISLLMSSFLPLPSRVPPGQTLDGSALLLLPPELTFQPPEAPGGGLFDKTAAAL